MFGFIAQIAINIYVLRASLAEDHPRAPQSDTRLAVAGTLLPFVGLVGLMPAGVIVYGLEGSTLGYVAGIGSALVVSLAAQSLFIAKMHRVSFGGALCLATKLWFVGAGVGVLAIIHPLIPIAAVGGFLAYKSAQKRSTDRLSEIADML